MAGSRVGKGVDGNLCAERESRDVPFTGRTSRRPLGRLRTGYDPALRWARGSEASARARYLRAWRETLIHALRYRLAPGS